MYKFEFVSQEKENTNIASLIFQGDLNLLNIKKIEKEVRQVPEKFAEYKIKIERVTDIDVPFLQLIHSFAVSKKKSQKKISIEMDLEGENDKLVKKSGFLNNNEFIRN